MAKTASKRTGKSMEQRISSLISRMTLEEKCAQIASVDCTDYLDGRKVSRDKLRASMPHGIGEISRVGGDTDLRPEEVAAVTREIQAFLKEETRLAIPALVHEECCSGHMTRNATMFPQAIAMASSWEPDLVAEMAAVIRRTMRAVGVHEGLAPLLDVARDPRWGRIEESFGEDPYLVAAIACAYVRGLQGEDLSRGVAATAKHFAAYGIPDGGRNIASARLGWRELRDTFLWPFEAACKTAGLATLMNAYHEIDGIPCAASRQLLTEILREEWGWKGIVVSDYGTIEMLRTWHFTAADRREAAKAALEAGIDVELNRTECYGKPLIDAVHDGYISEEYVDRAARRVLRTKMLLGLFDNPGPSNVTAAMFDTPADRALARRAGAQGIVLLKNEGGVLPLKSPSRIAVVGPNADSKEALLGDYSYMASTWFWRKLPRDFSALRLVTVLEGVKARAGEGVEVAYAKGCEIADASTDLMAQAVETAAGADVILAVMGENAFVYCGEMKDRDDLRLLGVQEQLVRDLAATGVPVVLVLLNGRPVALGGVEKYCAAIVEAWFPGEEGGNAVADVLFGDVTPSGKLPVGFPENVGQLPVHYAHKPLPFRGYVPDAAKAEARYPFGHGLSYAAFAYGGLEIAPDRVDAGGKVSIQCTIENIGHVEGAEVVQLYVRDLVGSVARPVKELKGFAKVTLAPGKKTTVTFELDTQILAFTDEAMKLRIEAGCYDVYVGSSSEDIRLKGAFHVADTMLIDGRTVFSTPATADGAGRAASAATTSRRASRGTRSSQRRKAR